MSDLLQESALEKLAHLLKKNRQELGFLENLSPTHLTHLYHFVAERLQLDPSPFWERLAKVAAFIPNFINARIAEDILGPHITANLTYHIPIKDALAISRHFSVRFMAEVAEELVPAKAKELLQAFPIEDTKKITQELLRQEKYYTMGTFVDVLPISTLLEVAKEITDEAKLLQIAVYSLNKAHLAEVLKGFNDDRLLRLVQQAENLQLWPQILGVVSHFDENMRKRIANLVNQFSEAELLSMLKTACALEIAEDLVVITKYLSDLQKKRLAQLIPQLNDAELVKFISAAHNQNEALQILQIAVYLDPTERERIGKILPLLSDEEILNLIGTAFPARLVPIVVEIASYAPPEEMARIRKLLSSFGEEANLEMQRVAGEIAVSEKIRQLFG